MSAKNDPEKSQSTQAETLVMERTLDAPIALVWRAITTKEEIRHWSFNIKELRLQAGFEFQFYGESETHKFLHHCKIKEIIPERKFSYTWRYEGVEGDSLVTWELFPEGNKTRLKLTHEGLETFPFSRQPDFARKNFEAGWNWIGDILKKYVEANPDPGRELFLSRIVGGPRELVWRAMTEAKHVVNWWGPHGFSTTIEEMDVRPGGVWKQVMHGPDGGDYPSTATFTEVMKPYRLSYRHHGGKKGSPIKEFDATWSFDALGDGTTEVMIRMVFATKADRDTVEKEYKAIEGGTQTLQRLSEYLPKLS